MSANQENISCRVIMFWYVMYLIICGAILCFLEAVGLGIINYPNITSDLATYVVTFFWGSGLGFVLSFFVCFSGPSD